MVGFRPNLGSGVHLPQVPVMKNRLPELREERGLSQRELADRVGVTRQTVNAVERERYDPSLELAFDLAEEFDCLVEDIFLCDGDEEDV